MATGDSIAIIGGGLAGLAAAHALSTVGLRAEIYEAAPALGEIGAAVNTSPNANKALIAIGVGDEIAKVANSSPGIYTRNMQTGEFLEFRDRRKTSARYHAPYYTFHRADLLGALAAGLDPSTIHLGHRLSAIEDHGGTIALTFANGSSAAFRTVIAADGVRSVARQALYGDDNPTYTGQMVWRVLLKGSDVPADVMEPTGHIQWVGPGCHLLAYYIRGTELVNIVTQEDTDKWVEEGWSNSRRSRRDAAQFSQSRAASRKAVEPRYRMLEMGAVHAAADGELGSRAHTAHRRRRACHAAQCGTRRLHGFRRRLYPRALARRGR